MIPVQWTLQASTATHTGTGLPAGVDAGQPPAAHPARQPGAAALPASMRLSPACLPAIEGPPATTQTLHCPATPDVLPCLPRTSRAPRAPPPQAVAEVSGFIRALFSPPQPMPSLQCEVDVYASLLRAHGIDTGARSNGCSTPRASTPHVPVPPARPPPSGSARVGARVLQPPGGAGPWRVGRPGAPRRRLRLPRGGWVGRWMDGPAATSLARPPG